MSDEPTVLIIDDDRSMRLTLSLILEDEGYRVLTAASGEDGLAMARTNPVDVALVDMRMPSMPGDEVCQRMRDVSPQTTVIVITAHVAPRVVERAVAAGAHSILYKPLDLDALLDQIRDLVTAEARCAS
ncbi:MAG: response regulator [Armatimonadota bacterium]